jgi:hypothetical protein
MMLCSLTPASAQLSINFSTPGVSIGVNLPGYPQLQRIPGYPVYYAPSLSSNYFFYDGLYWVFDGDNWYASSWYNGPWGIVDSMDVPLYLLRVPVRYYRRAPVYFRGWIANDPPRWGDHWGQSWMQRRSGWDRWNRNAMPAPAPLPSYQRQYSGSRYPQASQQAVIQTRNYRYQPRDDVAQQHFQQQRSQAQSAQPRQAAPQPPVQPARPAPVPRQQQSQQPNPQDTGQPQRGPGAREQQAPRPPAQRAERQPQPAPAAREQQAPRPQAHEQAPPAREQSKEQGRGRDNNEKGNRGKDNKETDNKERDPKERGQDR